MKTKIFCGLIFVLVVFLAFNTAAFAGEREEGEEEEVKLLVWINGMNSYIGPEEQTLPQDQWYISGAFKRFEAAHPGVTVELFVPPDEEGAHQSFKAAVMGGTAPDIANLWTGQAIFNLKDVILPITDMVPQEDLDNIFGWESLRLDFKPDGEIIGYPASQNQICFLMYNKRIIRDAGLDFDNNPPRTFDEFDAALDRIKALGVDPIVTDESFPWFWCWVGAYWWAQETLNDQILEETQGLRKFTNDRPLVNALAYYNALYENGYLNEDMGTSADSWNRFLQGKGAMYPVVTTFLSDGERALGDDCGVLMPPDCSADAKITNSTIGGPGQSLVVAKSSKHPELAVALISFLNSKDEVIRAQKIQQAPPVRTDLTVEELGYAPGSNIAYIYENFADNYIYWPDNLLGAGPAEIYYRKATLVGLGKMSPEEMVAEMEAAVK
jgi:raffinose/stachyose/melibiose transport system substrate-binding protein